MGSFLLFFVPFFPAHLDFPWPPLSALGSPRMLGYQIPSWVPHVQSEIAKPGQVLSALTSETIKSEKQIALSFSFQRVIRTDALKNGLKKTDSASLYRRV